MHPATTYRMELRTAELFRSAEYVVAQSPVLPRERRAAGTYWNFLGALFELYSWVGDTSNLILDPRSRHVLRDGT